MRLREACFLAAFLLVSPVQADDLDPLGVGRMFTNDAMGDGHDRWRSGSYVISNVKSRQTYNGELLGFGDIIEYRLRTEIISATRDPDAPGTRPYVGAISIGAHTHFVTGSSDASLGADIVFVGPQTGLADFQEAFHDAVGMQKPATGNPIGNDVFISNRGELSQTFALGSTMSFRPFVEAQLGGETLVRVGGDILLGSAMGGDLLIRDVATGQLYQATESQNTLGASYSIGADFAAVADSIYLPENQGFEARGMRTRLRGGVHYQMNSDASVFYGLTYLSEEFVGQSEGQLVGSLRLNFNF